MKVRYYIMILLGVFSNISMWGAISIAEVSRQFVKNEIDVDSLLNYIYDANHSSEVYWWALHNSEKNEPMANFILGRCYLSGIGTTEDMPKAVSLFEKANNQGIDEALVDLGRVYLYGWGVEKNREKGIQYLKKAADKKIGRGCDFLGGIYRDEKNYHKAYQLFKSSAAADYSGDNLDIGYLYEFGLGVEQSDAKALEFYMKAAEKGNITALCNVGGMYEYGKGVDMDHEIALKYYRASAATGDARGIYKVGYMYQWGDILEEVPYEEVARWYKKSAEMDYAPAKVELASMMFDGLGMPEDKPQAISMLESVDKRYVGSLSASRIAEYYINTNPVKALEWAKHAYDTAEEHISAVESAKLLGIIYLKGGKEVYDYDLAVKYLREGAEMDQPDCITMMKALGEPFEDAVQTISPRVRDDK